MRQVSEEYEKEFGVKPTQQEVADLLGTSLSTLQSLIKSAASTVSMDSSAFQSDPDASRKFHETLVDDNARDPDEEIDRKRLVGIVREALTDLSPREETVLRLRFGITEPELAQALQERSKE